MNKLYFLIANIILISAAIWWFVPDRISIVQGQNDLLALKERQFLIMEENYNTKDENIELLAGLEQSHIIQPPGQLGAIMTDIRTILLQNNLIEQDFFASEQATHYIEGRMVIETRGTLSASGRYYDINNFIKNLADHRQFIRLEDIQISKEFIPTGLWLTFAIYEENR